jgi:hypothetical protein
MTIVTAGARGLIPAHPVTAVPMLRWCHVIDAWTLRVDDIRVGICRLPETFKAVFR